ncbi:MAG: hypothetical protein V4538_05795 [Bacteroidota bacterium]
MKKIILFSLVIFSCLGVIAQKNKAPEAETIKDAIKIHKELNMDDAEASFKVIPVDSQGLIVAYMPESKAKNGLKDFIFKKLDVSFEEDYKTKITINKDYKILDYQFEGENLYFLFTNNKNSHGNTFLTDPYFKDYLLVKLNIATKEIKTFPGLLDKALHLKQMLVKNGVVSLAGKIGPTQSDLQMVTCLSACLCYIPLIFYTPTFKPYIVNVDMKTKSGSKKEFLMENYGKGIGEIVDIDQHDSIDELSFTVKHKYKKISKLSIRTIKGGKLNADVNIKIPQNIEVYKGKLNHIDAENKVIVGAYGPITGMKTGTGNVTQGIYVGMMTNNKQKFFKTIPWNKFKNFKVATTRAEDKAIKKSAKTGKAANITMQVIFHDVIVREDEKVFFGETYYPKYETHTEVSMVNGRMQTRTVTVFVGYQYSGTLIFAISNEGELLWDNGFNVNGPLTFFLKERFKFYETGDNEYTVVYNDGYILKTQTFDKENNTRNFKQVDMSNTEKKGDKITASYTNSDIEYWYDDYYIASGSLDIKNKNEKGKNKKRSVFYFNKIELPLYD